MLGPPGIGPKAAAGPPGAGLPAAVNAVHSKVAAADSIDGQRECMRLPFRNALVLSAAATGLCTALTAAWRGRRREGRLPPGDQRREGHGQLRRRHHPPPPSARLG